MKHNDYQYPYFMNHPFWDVLRIGSGSDTFRHLGLLDGESMHNLVCEAVKGFYPVSYASLLAFKRFSELTEFPEAKAVAYEIYQVESGNKPLVEGSELTGVRHCDQLKRMFESLTGRSLAVGEPERFPLLQFAKLPEASLTKALAVCCLIEQTAPFVIHFYQDFLIQCQVARNIPSERIERSYLDEHNLTEGDACPDQHIHMLGRMMSCHADIVDSPAFEAEQHTFIDLVCRHFEEHRRRITQIIHVPAA